MMADYKPVWAKQLREALAYVNMSALAFSRACGLSSAAIYDVTQGRGAGMPTLLQIENTMLDVGYALHFAGDSAGKPDVDEARRGHVLDTYATEEDAGRVWAVVRQKLTAQEAEALRLRFEEKLTLDGCGAPFRVSRERVRQIVAKALRKLRHPQALRLLEGLCSVAS